MTVDEYIRQLGPYFWDKQHDVLTLLPSEEFDNLRRKLGQAIDEHYDDCTFWFWKGWALQFYGSAATADSQHPDFEEIEHAYSHVLELAPDRVEAHFMLAYLYWDSAKRAKIAAMRARPDAPHPEFDPEIVDYGAGRQQWQRFHEQGGVCMIMHVGWALYPFQARAWSKLLERMLYDIVPAEDRLEVYLSWGYHWLNCDYGAENSEKRNEAYVRVRWAFGQGAATRETEHTCGMKLDCQYLLAKFHASKFGGDPLLGLQAWLKYGELAVEYGMKYFNGTQMALRSGGNNTSYEADDIAEFWKANQSLEKCDESLNIILKLEELGVLDLSAPGSGKLNWYLGRRYANWQELDRAERYLTAARRELPEKELTVLLALVLYRQGKVKETKDLVMSLPRDALIDELVQRLAADNAAMHGNEFVLGELKKVRDDVGLVADLISTMDEDVTTALMDLRKSLDALPAQKGLTDDEIAAQFADVVKEKLAELVAEQKGLYSDVQRKCEIDLFGTWALLPSAQQGELVDAESSLLLFQRNSMPNYYPLVFQWSKVIELLLKIALLKPLGRYIDKKGMTGGILTNEPREGDRFNSDQISRLKDANWVQTLTNLKFGDTEYLLYGAQQRADNHIVREYLESIGIEPHQIAAFLNLVPGQLHTIRDRRNIAVHEDHIYTLSDALEIRSILFSGGLLAQIGVLLRKLQSNRTSNSETSHNQNI